MEILAHALKLRIFRTGCNSYKVLHHQSILCYYKNLSLTLSTCAKLAKEIVNRIFVSHKIMKNGCAETKYQAGIEKFKDKLAVLFDISGCICVAIVKCADVIIVIYNEVPKLSRYSCLLILQKIHARWWKVAKKPKICIAAVPPIEVNVDIEEPQ